MYGPLKAICGMLLSGALLAGCDDTSRAGCTNSTIVLFDHPCLNSNQCPECDPPCEAQGGTRVSGPDCVLEVGFGFYCACWCEFCVDGSGGTGGDGGSAGASGNGGAGGG